MKFSYFVCTATSSFSGGLPSSTTHPTPPPVRLRTRTISRPVKVEDESLLLGNLSDSGRQLVRRAKESIDRFRVAEGKLDGLVKTAQVATELGNITYLSLLAEMKSAKTELLNIYLDLGLEREGMGKAISWIQEILLEENIKFREYKLDSEIA
jgi:hypothetical protein